MVRVFAMALLLLAGSVFYSAPAEAATAEWPKLKALFQKKGKSGKAFKKSKKAKYYHAAAKKQRKAKWQRNTMVQ
ncbi:hypothetical protein [Pontibacter anaerobius]|uniref:Uncharacterized protein n=1 Tax=Pontibacter anaerobius TaxID=2993940 RepID=A0ABT3RCG5_9BACT|nr:hypothetical protein [Pontibacter anaerobius]MCX2739556.1 hypothetical protein [Pontibacter anaerobius]